MDWEKLTNDVTDAATAAFSAWIAEHGGEHFYAFVLYTDGDCYTVEAAANSLEQHQATLIEADATDERVVAGYKWHTGEWAYEGYDSELFIEVYRQLENHRETLSSSMADYAAYKYSVHECMIAALKRMDANGFFAKMRDSIVIFVSSTDYDDAMELENRSAKQLNSESVYLSFIERYPPIDSDS